MPAVVGLIAAMLVFSFVATSSLIAILPEFEYASQLPALLPFFLWAAAAGVGHMSNLGRGLASPWRASLGIWSFLPYAVLMVVTAAVPELTAPWWVALVVAGVAALPLMLVAARSPASLHLDPAGAPSEQSRRGTFLIAIAELLMTYAVTQNVVIMATMGVLLAVALAVASLMPHGLAHASRTWGLAHWISLGWGSVIVWASALLTGTTSFFTDPWFVLTAVVIAPMPLLILNGMDARRAEGQN